MNKISIFLLSLFVLQCLSLSSNRVLVVLDNDDIQNSHSSFFKDLQARGYDLIFKLSSDSSLHIEEYGEYLYDHVIIFSPRTMNRDNFGKSNIADFIDAGYNVIIAGDENVKSLTKGIAGELGVTFGDSMILDPEEKFDAKLSNLRPFIGNSKISEVSYKGISISLSPSKISTGFLFPLLKSSSQSKPRPSTTLLAGFQARNNARALISGSLSFFSNEFYESNNEFLKEVSKWVFKERGILRVSEVHHSRVNETETPDEYTINDNVTFSFKVEELVDGLWVPYVTNDLQLEFRMVDPYIRRTLKPARDGKYSLTFTLPDVYGVFTFRVNYRKYGYTRFEIIERTPVRPYRHTQYERFLESATPYYLSSLSMLFGVFVFSIVFLYQKDDPSKEKTS